MKFVLGTLSILLSAWLLGYFFPWWVVAVASFLGGFLVFDKGGVAFLSGFMAISVLWGLHALIIDQQNGAILSTRIAKLFELPSPILVVLATALVGGAVGGLSSMTGAFLSSALKPQRKSKY